MSLKERLLKQLAAEHQNVRWLMFGASIFFTGMGLIYFSEHYMPANLKQELVALGGLALLGIGALVAATAYLMILINRLGIFNHDQ